MDPRQQDAEELRKGVRCFIPTRGYNAKNPHCGKNTKRVTWLVSSTGEELR